MGVDHNTLQELDILVNGSIKVPAILDTSSQIVVIQHNIVQALGVPINYQWLIEMEGANGATNWTVGCAEDLPLQVGNVVVKVHAHIVEHATFSLLLGRPFQQATLCHIKDTPSSEVEVSVRDPANLSRRLFLSTCPHTGHASGVKMVSVRTSSHPPPSLPSPVIVQQPLPPLLPADPETLVLKYKCIDKKIRPIPATLPEEYRTVRRIPKDPLLSLPPLLTHPPEFTPGKRFTHERLDDLKLNPDNFLWPEEVKLAQHILELNEHALA